MLLPEIKVSSRLAKNTVGTFRGTVGAKTLGAIKSSGDFKAFFFFPLMHHMNHKYPQTSHLCVSLQTELTGG